MARKNPPRTPRSRGEPDPAASRRQRSNKGKPSPAPGTKSTRTITGKELQPMDTTASTLIPVNRHHSLVALA